MDYLPELNQTDMTMTTHGYGGDPSLTKTRKKKTYYFQRDSLKKRNMLLVGKEGSRRRQRYDNGNFTHHPCAVLYEDDLYAPGYHPTKEALWSQPEIAAWLLEMGDNEDDIYIMDATFVDDEELRPYTAISHRVHQDLKKQHVPQGMVFHYEQALVDFITHGDDGDSDYFMVLEVNNPFDRFVIHTMCRFHNIESYSEQKQNGQCLLYVIHPLYAQNSDDYSGDGSSYSLDRSFFDYLFSDSPCFIISY